MTRIELARLRASRAKRAFAAASVAGLLVWRLAGGGAASAYSPAP